MKISLKMRVFIVFFGVLFLLAGSYLFTVTRFITRFTTKQLNDDYNSLLLEVSETMQNLLWNLTLTMTRFRIRSSPISPLPHPTFVRNTTLPY